MMEKQKIIWIVLGLIILLAGFSLLFRQGGSMNSLGSKSDFINEEYKISLKYPSGWKLVPEEGRLRYEGEDGFFEASLAGGKLSLADIISSESNHTLKPYGSSPQVETIEIEGQTGALIMPSGDADPSMGDQAALIIPYPGPIEVNGEPYDYFVLWADKDHIRDIAGTINFLN